MTRVQLLTVLDQPRKYSGDSWSIECLDNEKERHCIAVLFLNVSNL